MRYLRAFGRFCYDFVVGDDWTVVLVVVAGIALTALLAHHGVVAWWCMPVAVTASLALSLTRAIRHR
jgi:hypothetical protein